MSKRNKLLKKFFAEKPPVDITWNDLVAVASLFDCTPDQRTNHRVIKHASDPKWVYPIPVHSDGVSIKRTYIVELRQKFIELKPEVLDEI